MRFFYASFSSNLSLTKLGNFRTQQSLAEIYLEATWNLLEFLAVASGRLEMPSAATIAYHADGSCVKIIEYNSKSNFTLKLIVTYI
jgi:hypothetical protein